MNLLDEFDTISAIATPLGTGGVGVIRLSGDKAFDIIDKIYSKHNLTAGKISHGWILDNDRKIDEVIVLPFRKPNSYTGEDVIEIHCHGGVNVARNILDLTLKNGARMAERGEYTKRAFLNKKMDLSQAEAVADLIHAKTKNFAILSAKNLSGVLAHEVENIKSNLFEMLSRIVAGIDFPEDVAEPEYSYLVSGFEKALAKIEKILACVKSSDILRQGVKIAIVGKPNVGKSSLFNSLLNMERAIVTDIAGTTRDVIKENLDWDVAVTLIDTAGIRSGSKVGRVEEIGIEYSKQSADEADLVIFMYDSSQKFTSEDFEIYELIKSKKHFVVANKADLPEYKNVLQFSDIIKISTLSGFGIDSLKDKIKLEVSEFSSDDTEFITNKRQQECLIKCKDCLLKALEAAKIEELQDMISIDLKAALLSLDEITGEVITDEILDNIFSHFCIGK